MYYKRLLTGLLLILTISSCGQEKQKNNVMEEEIIGFQHQMYNKIQKFDKRPLYLLQVNKNNCRVLVTVNGIPHWVTLYENYGESMSLFLNNYIPKSGKQLITVQVFPKEGQQFIADNADVDLKVRYAADKDNGVDTYQTLTTAELPVERGDKPLNDYEIKIPFEAHVPFDFSKELEGAKELKNIPDIEEKVVAKYHQLRALLVKGDGLSFAKEFEYSDLKSFTHLYATKEELIEEKTNDNPDVKRARLDVKNRKVYPIENYEIIFSSNGKLVMLRSVKDKKDMLRVEFDIDKGVDGEEKPVVLYMPAGNNELKVW